MSDLKTVIDEDSGSIVYEESRIPISHVSHLTYCRKYSAIENFINAFLKSLKFIFLLIAIYVVLNIPAVDHILGSKLMLHEFNRGFCEGLEQPLDKCHESPIFIFALFFWFAVLLIVNVLDGNPYVIKITSSSGESIFIKYKGDKEKIRSLFTQISLLVQNSR